MLSASSVTFINDLNESYKFSRHYSMTKSFFMVRQIMAELNSHGTLQSSGLSTVPPSKRQRIFPGTPPGIWSLADYVDPDILQWHEAAESDIVRTAVPTTPCSFADSSDAPIAVEPSSPITPPVGKTRQAWADVTDDLPDDLSLHSTAKLAPVPGFPSFAAASSASGTDVAVFASEPPPVSVDLPKGDDDDAENVVCDYRKHSSKVCICDGARYFCRKHSKYPVCATCGNDLCDAFDGNDMCLRCPSHPSATSCSADAFNEKSFSMPKASSEPTRVSGHSPCDKALGPPNDANSSKPYIHENRTHVLPPSPGADAPPSPGTDIYKDKSRFHTTVDDDGTEWTRCLLPDAADLHNNKSFDLSFEDYDDDEDMRQGSFD